LQKRVAFLLRPNTLEEIQRLDPRKDFNQIVHFVSYDFRAELKVLSANYELRPAALPYTAMLFESTGAFTRQTVKRFEDTFLLFANLVEWGIDSRRGRACREEINRIHGRMAIPNDGYLFVLGNFMFVPIIRNERFGWRKFTDVERLGWFHQFVEVGRALNVEGLIDDYDEMRAWWDDLNQRYCKHSAACRRVFDTAVDNLLATTPRLLRSSLREMVVASLDDTFRACTRYEPPSPELSARMRRLFRWLGAYLSTWPRRPWARTLMNYKTYPNGHRIEDLGVKSRAARLPNLPVTAGGKAKSALPEGLPPIASPESVPGHERLPELSWEEIARHDREGDAWLVFEGHVYDVTAMLVEHPGGKKILLKHLGQDATRAFQRAKHSAGAQIITANYRIGRASARSSPPRGEP
jgi:predicted heme/steroid binding protein